MVNPTHIVGLICSLSSVLLSNIGLLIQKYGTEVEKDKPLCRRWRFWCGWAINIGSEISLSTLALHLAPLALIAPSGGFGIICNAFLARYGCVWGTKEILTRADWAATVMLTLGVVCVATSGPGSVETDVVPLDEVPALLLQPPCLAFMAFTVISVVSWMLVSKTSYFPRLKPADSSIATTVCAAWTSAMIGSFSVVSLKLVVMGIAGWVADGRIEAGMPPLAWACLVFLVVFGWWQLYLLNVALASGQAMFAIPLYLSAICVCISLAAGIVFNEFTALLRDPFPLYVVTYCTGLLLVLLALAGLAYSQNLKSKLTGADATATMTRPAASARVNPMSPRADGGAGQLAKTLPMTPTTAQSSENGELRNPMEV